MLFTLAYFAQRAAHIALFFLDWQTEMINGSFRTLRVEARWYVHFPLALLMWAPHAFIAVATASTLAFIFTRLHAIDVGTLLPFLLRVIAADVRARGMHLEKAAFTLLPVAIALALLLAPFVTMPSPLGGETAGNFLQIDRAIGTASYSVYLAHEPIMGFIEAQVALPLALRIGGSPSLSPQARSFGRRSNVSVRRHASNGLNRSARSRRSHVFSVRSAFRRRLQRMS